MKRETSAEFSIKGKMAGKNVDSAKHPFIMGALLLDIHFTMGPLVAKIVYLSMMIVVFVLRSQKN